MKNNFYSNTINQNCLDGFVSEKHAAFHFKMLIDGLESSVIVMILSTYSDGTHSPQRIKWCNVKIL